MRQYNFQHRYRQQTGLSMVEILVSVLILSIGLLGIAGLQGTSLKSTRSASLRTQAIVLTQDIIESMRANRGEALSGSYSINFGSSASSPTVDCFTVSCTPSALATFDLHNWWEKVHDTQTTSNESKFPLGEAQITVNTVDNVVTVSIKWRDNVKQNIKNPSQAVDEFTTFSTTSKI